MQHAGIGSMGYGWEAGAVEGCATGLGDPRVEEPGLNGCDISLLMRSQLYDCTWNFALLKDSGSVSKDTGSLSRYEERWQLSQRPYSSNL
jgi:hypothetical protein